MPTYLHALALRYYRGIGTDIQRLTSFRDFNFFIGANNTGKSTVLDFLAKYLSTGKKARPAPTQLDSHTGATTGGAYAAIGIPIALFTQNVVERSLTDVTNSQIKTFASNFCSVLAQDGFVWLQLAFSQSELTYAVQPKSQAFHQANIPREQLSSLWHVLTRGSGGSPDEHWIPQVMARFLAAQNPSFPKVRFIPAIREIGPKEQQFSDFSGRGLIDRLAEIQSPDHDK